MMGMVENWKELSQGLSWRSVGLGLFMTWEDIVLVADSEMELQTMLAVVQGYVMRWRMKPNSRKSKIMVVGKREGGMSWKIGEEIMEEVEVLG